MRLALQDLCSKHPVLRGHPTDLGKCGGLALQRSGHASPVVAGGDHDGVTAVAEIEWLSQGLSDLEVLDSNRVTEDGAEVVAIAYANSKAGWVVKPRLQRGEFADWLLRSEAGWLALEVSGTISGEPLARLEQKKQQVARCALLASRLAIVVVFDRPLIVAGAP